MKTDAENIAAVGNNPHYTKEVIAAAQKQVRTQDLFAEAEDRRVNGVRNSVEMLQKARDYDPSKDKNGAEFYTLIQETKRRVNEDSDGTITGLLNHKFSGKPIEIQPRQEITHYAAETMKRVFDPETGVVPWKKPVPDVDANGSQIFDEYMRPKTKLVEDTAAQQRATDAETSVMLEFNNWRRLNPEKGNDPAEARKKLMELVPDGYKAGAYESARQLLGKPQANAAGTVTSYGYANDETPDRNSRAGIGAFVPDAEIAKIKRGEPSDYKLRTGDLAVSPDVEAEFRRAGVKPMDKVLVKMADGSVHRARWMDVTATDDDVKSGRIRGVTVPLRGRFDLYSPHEKHSLDGEKVVGWQKL